VGAVLADPGTVLLPCFSRYALALGEAYQLRDDLLGVMGDPAETGKSIADDVRSGKETVLAAIARQNASPAQRAEFDGLWGNARAEAPEIERLRRLFTETGAVRAVEDMIAMYASAAGAALAGAPIDEDARAGLTHLVEAATRRRS
jgi:geranylgeranyl diphosphate synthase type I